MEKATNGQFREFIGKLLVKGSDEKVAQIDKTKIQKVIDSLSSNDSTVFENFINFINNEGCLLVDGFISKVFKKTSTINYERKINSFMIREKSLLDFFKPIIRRENELKNPEPFLNDISLLKNVNGQYLDVSSKKISFTVYRFISNLTHKQILSKSCDIGIKKSNTYFEGLSEEPGFRP